MRTLVLLLAALLGAGNCGAALFDTVAQVEARYGKPVSGSGDRFIYQKDGMQITVGFIVGRAHLLEYTRGDNGLERDEVKALLEANRIGAGRWKLVRGRWATEDGTMEAISIQNGLRIFSKQWKGSASVEGMLTPPPAIARSKAPPPALTAQAPTAQTPSPAAPGILRGRIIQKDVKVHLVGMKLLKPGVYVEVNGERIFLPHLETTAIVGETIEVAGVVEKGRTEKGERWFQ